jgi:hypothetical protein
MWVTHVPSKDQGVYLSSVGNDTIRVWSKAQRTELEWRNIDIEVVLDDSSSDEFSDMLFTMAKHKDAFKEQHLLRTCINTIQFYMEDERLSFETMDERLKVMQEVLYHTLGKNLELGMDRDKAILFIHNTLPHLMVGALVGYHLGKNSELEPAEPEPEEPVEPEPKPKLRRKWCILC